MHRAIIATLALLLLATSAGAADLTLALTGVAEYDDNVFRNDLDEEEDVLFRLRPSVRVHEDRGDDLNFSVRYDLPVEIAVDNGDELNQVDHVVDGDFVYHVNDRIDIFGNEQFRYLRSTLRRESIGTDDVVAGGGVPTIADDRDRVTLNDASLGVSYRFAPRLLGRVQALSNYFDSDRDDRATNYSISGVIDAIYTLTPKHQVGGGVLYTYQEFDEIDQRTGSETNTYNVFASWRWLIDETTNLEIQAGPTIIQSEQDDSDRVRVASAVPFQVIPNGVAFGSTSAFFDSNGNSAANQSFAPGSLVVPSFFVGATPGGRVNCVSVDGQPVAQGCAGNVILDANADGALVNAIRTTNTSVVNTNRDGADSEDIDIFAQVVLTKRWLPTLSSALRYSRRQGNAAGLGGAVILDAVSLSNTWNFAERWQLTVRGDWTRRESVFDQEQTLDVAAPVVQVGGVPVGDPLNPLPLAGRSGTAFNASSSATSIDTERWGVAGRLTHRLFRSTEVFAQVRYDEQDSDGDTLGAGSDFTNFLATVGVRHTFDPIKLW